MKEQNLVGFKIHKLTAVEKIKRNGRCWYRCECECGGETIAEGSRLKAGLRKSCGCARKGADPARGRRLPKGLAAARTVISSYKRNAARRGIAFNLTEDECLSIMRQPCAYCGRKPSSRYHKKNCYGAFRCSGIDRVDNAKGYTLGNVAPCCKDCNRTKHQMSVAQFKRYVRRLYQHFVDGS